MGTSARCSFKGLFNPVQLGVISAWLRVPLAAVTNSGISSLPDVLSSNPAVQSTDAARPPLVAAGNGLLVAQGVDDRLQWPANSTNNQLVTWGFAAHVLLDDVALTKTLLRIGLATSNWPQATDSLRLAVASTRALFLVLTNDATGVVRRSAGSSAGMLASDRYVFMTVEINLGASGEANQVVMSFDGVADTLTFADDAGTPGAMPAAMQGAVTDIALLGERINSNRLPFIGHIGPNIYILGSAMPGVTSGLLTPAARVALSNFERPTV